ncbi:hypothetical protein D3C77_563550 [compost metagenome]
MPPALSHGSTCPGDSTWLLCLALKRHIVQQTQLNRTRIIKVKIQSPLQALHCVGIGASTQPSKVGL